MTRTRRLYHEDPELRTFEATVISVAPAPDGLHDVVLDRTAFYPTGGGQPHDRGTLGGIPVRSVLEVGEAVVHRLTGRPEATTLRGIVDWERRTDHRQQHTGQHLLSRAFLEVAEAATVGFHLGETTCTIDLDREPGEADIVAAESLANRIVLSDAPVETRWYESARDLPPGLRKEAEVEGPIRVVAAGSFDATPCCGTHCGRTGEAGLIKILRNERRRGGLRVEFVCGNRSLLDYRQRHRALRAAAQAFSTEDLRVPERAEALLEGERALRARLTALEGDLRERLVEAWGSERSEGPFARRLEDGRTGWLVPMATALAARRGGAVLLASSEGSEARAVLGVPEGSTVHAGQTLKSLLEQVGGRGGGSDRLGQGKLETAAVPRLLEAWQEGGAAR